jgi:hypothetical protein
MWVFCCGMQRSASTLQFQIAAELVERAGLGERVGWVRPEQFPRLLDKHGSDGKWKVFKNHVCTPEMAAEFERGAAIGIYSYRDVRDVMASVMRKYRATFDKIWDGGFLESCLDNYRRWTSLPGVLVSKYEEVMADLPSEVQRIAAHIGLPVDRGTAARIAASYTRDRQLERIDRSRKGPDLQRGTLPDVFFDPHTLLHTDHITSGETGGWKTMLSPDQAALIEAHARGWLLGHGYALSAGTLSRSWRRLSYRPRRRIRALLQRLIMPPENPVKWSTPSRSGSVASEGKDRCRAR